MRSGHTYQWIQHNHNLYHIKGTPSSKFSWIKHQQTVASTHGINTHNNIKQISPCSNTININEMMIISNNSAHLVRHNLALPRWFMQNTVSHEPSLPK